MAAPAPAGAPAPPSRGSSGPASGVARAAATPGPGTGEAPAVSIHAHFDDGCNVLLTGASGYIGSLVLEKLLRSTRVGHVYLLLRPRRGVDPADRVAKLLRGPLFHLLDASEAARVSAVAGDILEPGLGLSPEDEAMLLEKVDTVIHCAAGEPLTYPALYGAGRPRSGRVPTGPRSSPPAPRRVAPRAPSRAAAFRQLRRPAHPAFRRARRAASRAPPVPAPPCPQPPLPPPPPDIRLDAPIQTTLRANYRGSCAMTRLAARMARLRSYVYVSTCYVNINKPPGFRVEEG
jgi:NAD(P)-dependent dehydrogenase (short-subunit alcohol dehydrogenase family)